MKKLLRTTYLIAFVFCGFSVSRVAANTDERNSEITNLTAEQKSLYRSLAETWAPLLFADSSETMDPADAIVSPYFDGDEDWSNNPNNIRATQKDENGKERAKFNLKSQLLFSLIETKTHYYISYTKYNAIDSGPGSHGQDSEVIWTVVKKEDQQPVGKLEFVVTNAHGFAKIYAPDEDFEKQLRRAHKNQVTMKNWLIGEQIYSVDKLAAAHHSFGRSEFLKSETGEARGLKVFVCREGHALYKCNTDKWEAGYGKGYVYACVPQGKEGAVECYPMRPQNERLVGYSLINQDELLIGLYPRNEAALSDSEKSELQSKRSKLFEGSQNTQFSAEVLDGKIKLRVELPSEIVRGTNDTSAEANTSNVWRMKISGVNLAVPHLIHRMLDPENSASISDEYIFNPYIEYIP